MCQAFKHTSPKSVDCVLVNVTVTQINSHGVKECKSELFCSHSYFNGTAWLEDAIFLKDGTILLIDSLRSGSVTLVHVCHDSPTLTALISIQLRLRCYHLRNCRREEENC